MKRRHWLRVVFMLILLAPCVIVTQPELVRSAPIPIAQSIFAAGEPFGQEFNISNLAPSRKDPSVPSTAYNEYRHEYMVVYHNDRAANDDIYGQRVPRFGGWAGTWFSIASGAGTDRQNPDIAFNSDDRIFLVVWQDTTTTTGKIMGQRVDEVGQLVGSQINIASTGPFHLYSYPAVVYATSAQRFLVVFVYVDNTFLPTFYSVQAQAIKRDGTLDGAAFDLPTSGDIYNNPDLAYNRTQNEFLVAWHQTTAGQEDIYGRRVKMAGGAGAMGTSSFPIINTSDNESDPAVAALPISRSTTGDDGQYFVVCKTTVGTTGSITGQRLKGDGNLEGGRINIASGSVDRQTPAVAGYEDAEYYLVTWKEPAGGMLIFDYILGRQVTWQGGTDNTEYVGAVYGETPAVDAGEYGSFLVAYQDTSLISLVKDIYGRMWGNTSYLPCLIKN